MSVTYYKCDVKGCGEINVSDASDDNMVKSDKFEYGQGMICERCSDNITEDMLLYDEEDDFSYLRSEFFEVKNKKIVLKITPLSLRDLGEDNQ